MGTLSQHGRLLEFTGPKGTEDCVLTEFTGTEGLSKDFEFELNLLSSATGLTAKQLIGKAVTVKLSHSSSETRIFNGIICSFDAGNIDYQGHRVYKLEIWPWFTSLQHHQDCRIFQRQTVPQIFTTICKDIGFYDYDVSKLGLNYKPLDYCVQYNETSYDFLRRILAEAGIYYTYIHTQDKHKLTLLDSKSSIKQYGEPIEQSNIHHSREHIHKWEPQQRKTPDTISARDYCFTDPGLNLQTSGKVGPPGGIPEALEKFLYPGGYNNNDQGDKKVNHHAQVENWQSKTISGASNVVNLLPGMQFKIENDNSYRVIEITHKSQTTKDAQTYKNELTCIPQGVTYSPPSHAKPKIRSQTAIVVGPKDQKTYTDKYGRVKVQFHWDRYGQQDENSSCWLRVAQPCAGPNWGAQFIPRPDSEVLVSFINGDPDRPIITGSYYNEANQPLSDNPAVSGIKTRITDDNKRGHHLLFDDTPGAEKFMLHSEGKLTIDTQNNSQYTVAGDENITIKGAHTTQVKQGKLNINAGTLTLKVGGSQVVLDQSGISIKPAGNLHLLATGVGDTKPVARVGDDHKCPKMINGTPHKGGPILRGSSVSKANGMDIAREGDKMHCISDSDTIKKGIPSILVDGKPIAKLNSPATHGGTIIAGSPNVFVGESKGSTIAPQEKNFYPSAEVKINAWTSTLPTTSFYPYTLKASNLLDASLKVSNKKSVNPSTFKKDGEKKFRREVVAEAHGAFSNLKITNPVTILAEKPTLTLYNDHDEYTFALTATVITENEKQYTGTLSKNEAINDGDWTITGEADMNLTVTLTKNQESSWPKTLVYDIEYDIERVRSALASLVKSTELALQNAPPPEAAIIIIGVALLAIAAAPVGA